jgi:hypothetical protein
MSIQVVCPTCEKTYKVKDEAAGKKMKCKGCETVIPIPAVAAVIEEPDPWDVLPEQGDEDEAAPRLPPVRRKQKPQPTAKRSRTRSADGMPVTVIVSIVLCGIMAAISGLAIVAFLLASNIILAALSLIRLAVNGTIIKGLIDRSNRLRWNAIIVDGLGLAWAFTCGAAMLFLGTGEQIGAIPGGKIGIVVALAFQIVVWITDLAVLLSPSARDYCNQ